MYDIALKSLEYKAQLKRDPLPPLLPNFSPPGNMTSI
jgi:hypothetical protein